MRVKAKTQVGRVKMKQYKINIKDMDLGQIAESGQVFRMKKEGDGFRVWKRKENVLVFQEGEDFLFHCSEEKFCSVWHDYFDLGRDYGKIKEKVDEHDKHLIEAIRFGAGIRILRQDLWEMIVSFIISQNNNISRIRSSIEKICSATPEGGFPNPEELVNLTVERLRSFGLGYRDEYVYEIARDVCSGELDMEALKKMDYEEAHKTLMLRKGIGKKVADCICVFGLHHLEAFPIDTHVKRILREHYPEGFPFERYRGFAAVIQQYLFYSSLNNK